MRYWPSALPGPSKTREPVIDIARQCIAESRAAIAAGRSAKSRASSGNLSLRSALFSLRQVRILRRRVDLEIAGAVARAIPMERCVMTLALVLFAVAAVGGAVLAARRFQGKELPMGLALAHGAAAAAGLVVLLLGVISGSAGTHARTPLVLFVIAALGGFLLFSFHLRKKDLPIPVVLIHAVVAVAAFALLLLGIG
jgi:hypothetical protein